MNINDLQIRNVTNEDIQLVFDWANEEGVRKQSFQSEPITWNSHQQWFSKRILANPYWYIMHSGSIQMGICRFDTIESNTYNINYSIERKFRGQNLGFFLLELVLKKISQEIKGENRYIARVKKENLASIKVFQKIGFSVLSEDADSFTYLLLI